MQEDLIRYDILVQDALRGVIRKVLTEVVKTGLPGQHHFFINFLTRAPGVRIPVRLLESFPQEMRIVLQNQFWDLKVSETGFEVSLSFGGKREIIGVPFAAIRVFEDESVPFRLEFDPEDIPVTAPAPASLPQPESAPATIAQPDIPQGEKIVSLDAFRKKP